MNLIENRREAELSAASFLSAACEEALEQGLEKGLEQGRQIGRNSTRIAIKMLKNRTEVHIICAESGLTLDEVKELRSELGID